MREVYVEFIRRGTHAAEILETSRKRDGRFPMWKAKGYVEIAENSTDLHCCRCTLLIPTPPHSRRAFPDRVSSRSISNESGGRGASKRLRQVEDKNELVDGVVSDTGVGSERFSNLPPSEREGKLWEYHL